MSGVYTVHVDSGMTETFRYEDENDDDYELAKNMAFKAVMQYENDGLHVVVTLSKEPEVIYRSDLPIRDVTTVPPFVSKRPGPRIVSATAQLTRHRPAE